MGELEEKLNTILGDPAAMGQIMALAQSLGRSAPESPQEDQEGGGETAGEKPGWERAGTVPVSAAPPPALETGGENPLAALSSLDPKLIQMGMRLWQEYQGGDQRTTDLLQALRPFLREERRGRLDRALQIARMTRMIRAAITALGERGQEEGV